MKKLALFTMMMMIFVAGDVLACGGSCDKDKDEQSAEYLCGGSCGGDKDKEPAPEPEVMCGGDKDKDPAPEPEAMCGGSGCGKDKEKEA